MRTASGSLGLMPTWKPAAKPSALTRWRATAAGMTRRSATSTPVDASPEIIARLIIRHAGVALARRDDAGAALQRRAERGGEAHGDVGREVDVDEPRDAVACRKMRVVPRDSQIRLSKICEPVSTSLYG